MPGDELEVQAGIGAFSAAAKPDITINGARQSLNSDGVADYKTKVEGAGEHTIDRKYCLYKTRWNYSYINNKLLSIR